MIKRTLALIALLLSLPFAAQAQQATTKPDKPETESPSFERPGFTNGTETIAPGHLQLETGYLYSNGHGAYEHRIDDGAQLRYPLSIRSEVRLGLPAFAWMHQEGSTQGLGDTSLSGKYRFLDDDKGRPSLALIAGTSLPTGGKDAGEHYFQPYASLEASRDLDSQYTLQASVFYQGGRDGGQHFNQWAQALNLGRHLTGTIDTFVEAYHLSTTGADSPSANYVDGGFTLLLQEKYQVDLSAGIGVSKPVRNDYFVSAGISRRW